jgi:hypothetical protein
LIVWFATAIWSIDYLLAGTDWIKLRTMGLIVCWSTSVGFTLLWIVDRLLSIVEHQQGEIMRLLGMIEKMTK